MVTLIDLLAAADMCPLWLVLKQPHRFDIIRLRYRKPMIDPSRQDHQIPFAQLNPNPLPAPLCTIHQGPVILHIKISFSVHNPPYLLVLVEVLLEERLHLALVGRTHALWGHGDLVPVVVRPGRGECVERGEVAEWDMLNEDAQGFKCAGGDGDSGVVWETLIALDVIVEVGTHFFVL